MEENGKRKHISVKWAWAASVGWYLAIAEIIGGTTMLNRRPFAYAEPYVLDPPPLYWLHFILPFVLLIASRIITEVFLRCNHCNRPIEAHHVAHSKLRYTYCPFCSGELDIK